MIVEQRTYTLKALRAQEFLKLYEEFALPLQRKYLGTLIGFFVGEVGALNQVVHLWAYDNMGDRERRRHAMESDPEWPKYLDLLRRLELVQSQESRFLKPASFSPAVALKPAAS